MRIPKLRTLGLALAAVLVAHRHAAAQSMPSHDRMTPAAGHAMPAKVLVNVDAHGVGLQGYDPVAFFTDSAAVRGDSTHTASYGGATYWFKNEAHRALFAADPEKYAPQFGGFCAYGAANGHAAPVEIDTWQVRAGKLLLNYDRSVRAKFDRDVAGYLSKAYELWPGIVAKEGK
jgi:YHS domain-containing protein